MPNTQVAVIGNLVRDPELRHTAAGIPVASFSIAVNEGDKTNPKVSYFDISVWRSLALNAVDTLSKGMRVVVVGALQQQTWETKEGDKRSKVQIVAEGVGPDLRFGSAKLFPNARPQDGKALVGYPEGDEPWQPLQRTVTPYPPPLQQTEQGTADRPSDVF
jgi:single-strand DNA-binding protein